MNNTARIMLYTAFKNLNEAAGNFLNGTEIETIKDTVNNFAISAALLGAAADVIPGAGGVLAALAQTGLVWVLYVKINNVLGISISEHTIKFIGSAILTNIITSAGYLIVAYAAAAVMSFIPVFGQAGSAITHLALGYILIYAAAVVYLNFLTHTFQQNGSFNIDESDKTKRNIRDAVNDTNVKEVIKEGKNAFKEARDKGEFEKAKKDLRCPRCGEKINAGQEFCTNCGLKLK